MDRIEYRIACTEEEFCKMMKAWGLDPWEDRDKVVRLSDEYDWVRLSDVPEIGLLHDWVEELKAA